MEKKLNEEMVILNEIAKDLNKLGAEIYFVGGFVRDLFTGKENKDVDVEVYGISPNQLKQVLSRYGIVDEVGASFGVYMIHGLSIDFSLPRRELQGQVIEEEKRIILPKNYEQNYLEEIEAKYPRFDIYIDNQKVFGHRDFIVIPDPFMTKEEASKRRDFTMNAVMQNVLTGEIIDIWNGQKDIENKTIRHVHDISFVEDPLRVLRACQFASRFEFDIDKKTIELCKTIDLSSLAKERLFEEFKKALMKSKKPSIALEWMKELLVVEKLFPELNALITCEQDPQHHAEGTVWNHVKKVIDVASTLKDESSDALMFMFGSLCHDMGKPATTKIINGRITSRNHAEVGEEVAETFMLRLTTDKNLIQGVKLLTKYHMRLLNLYPKGTDKAIRKLALDTNIQDMLLFAEADYRGKGLVEKDFTPIKHWFNQKLSELGADKKIVPIVTGKDLIEKGLKPGKEFGVILKEAMEYQLEGYEKEEIMKKLLI